MALPQGITKEFLDMSYPDQYYKNVIEPAKLGKGPVPGKIEMLSKSQPLKAMRIGIDPYLPKSMQAGYDAFRAAPTKYASTALNWLGKGITTLASLPAQAALMTLHSTPANAAEVGMTAEDFQNLYAQDQRAQRFKQQQLMNRRKQDMQQTIRREEAAAAAKQKAAAQAEQNRQASLQAQVTAQANREARRRVSRGKARDYGKTETRASSGWESSPFVKGGLVDLYRHGGFSG